MGYFDSIAGVEDLIRAIVNVENEAECRAFLEDLCTIKELQDISQRLSVAKMLDEGKNYQEISKATGASTATISRVKKCLVWGSGGYRTALERAKSEEAKA
jgi:TrpR-related protein YerC/YecD